jgi:hypothetical protein
MLFVSKLFYVFYAFFAEILNILEADIKVEFSYIAGLVAYLSYSWAAYFKGVYGPALFILVVGASFLAIYLIFGVAGIGKDIVEVG